MSGEGTTLYCGEVCNHTGPHRYPPAPAPVHVHKFVQTVDNHDTQWLPSHRRIYCEACGEVRSLDEVRP